MAKFALKSKVKMSIQGDRYTSKTLTLAVIAVAGLSDLDSRHHALFPFTDAAAASAVVTDLHVTRVYPTLVVNLTCLTRPCQS